MVKADFRSIPFQFGNALIDRSKQRFGWRQRFKAKLGFVSFD